MLYPQNIGQGCPTAAEEQICAYNEIWKDLEYGDCPYGRGQHPLKHAHATKNRIFMYLLLLDQKKAEV